MKDSLRGQCIAEFFATGLFLFFGAACLSAIKVAGAQFGLWEICIVWGMGISLAVYLAAGISGAHLNPAVTIGLWLFGNFERRKVLPYIASQTAGAFFGVAVCYFLYADLFVLYEQTNNMVRGSEDSLYLASIFSTYSNAAIPLWRAAIIEVVITATLMGLIFALTDDGNGVPKGPLAPLLIGLLVAVIGAATGPLTGFAMNPARDFGPKLFAFVAGWGEISFTGGKEIPYFIIPIVAPVIGAIIGGAGYRYFITRSLEAEKAAQILETKSAAKSLKTENV